MLKTILTLTCTVLICCNSFAQTEPATTDLKVFARTAPQVLRVSVLAGDAEGYGQVVYKARVEEVFKGSSKAGDIVFFGPFLRQKIGTDYILFLFAPQALAANGLFGAVTSWKVMREGYGQQEVAYSCGFQSNKLVDCRDSVRICTDYVRMPENIPVSSTGDASSSFGCKWFDLDAYLNELRTLDK